MRHVVQLLRGDSLIELTAVVPHIVLALACDQTGTEHLGLLAHRQSSVSLSEDFLIAEAIE